MSIRLLRLAPLFLAAGCASRLPSTGFAEPAALERAMNRYYEAHVTEDHGYCPNPYIEGVTQASVVTIQPDRLVVYARYLYRDRLKNDRNECTGYASRRFTFGKGPAGGVEVLDVSDPVPRSRIRGLRVTRPRS